MGNSSKEEQARVRSLLLDTVSLLCKNGLTHKTMKIQGLLGITINDDDVFVVHINDLVGATETDAGKRNERSASRESSSGKTPDKNRKRSATASPAHKGPPDKRNKDEVIVIGEEDRRRQMHDNRPIITNIRGGHTPQKQPGMRGPMMGSPNRMPFVRVIGSPNQRGGMLSPQRMMGQRGRPPMHAMRCQHCPGVFQNQMSLIHHMREIHPNMPQPGVPSIGQIRPIGPPMPAGVGIVKRNLYPQQTPVVVRKNRHENNSDAPIDIDASPPSADSGTKTPNAPGDQVHPTPSEQSATNNENQNQAAPTAQSPGSSQNTPTQNVDGEKAQSDKSDSGSRPDSRSGSRAGSRPGSRAGSRSGSIVNKSAGSDGSDTEGYSPASTSQPAGEQSSSSDQPLDSQQGSKPPDSHKGSNACGPTETTGTVAATAVSQTSSIPANAINIAPLQNSTEPPNLFDQLEDTFKAQTSKAGDVTKHTEPPQLSPQPTTTDDASNSQPPTSSQEGPPPLTPLQQNVTAKTFEIKPEGPFGSEIFSGQISYETQNVNRPMVSISQPGQFMGPNNMTAQGTTITVAPNPHAPPMIDPFPPPNVQQFPPHQQQAIPGMSQQQAMPPNMPMPGMPPQFMQNPYGPSQPQPGPPPFGRPSGPGFNGFF